MRNLVDLFVRFSHVFFVSRCCIYNDAHDPSQIHWKKEADVLEEEGARETPEGSRQAESSANSLQEGLSSREETQSDETKEILDEEFYDVNLN